MGMVPFSKYRRLLVATGSIIVTGSVTWSCYQVYQTYYALNQMFKSDVLELEKKRAEYIYIHDPKFKEEVCCMMNDEVETPQSTRDVFDMPMKWWKSWKHSYAWRLLAMAKFGDRGDRLKAVSTLSTLKSLNDSDFRQIAQVCDKRTAVGLARSEGVDLRFFLPPPYLHVTPTKQQLTDQFHRFFMDLQVKNSHACVAAFIKKAFPKIHQRHVNLHEDPTLEVPKPLIRTVDILPMCVENLLHHSNIRENAKDIVTLGGLPFLMDLYRHFKDNMDILIMLAKIVSNISICPEILQSMFDSGWIGVLALFAQNSNINLSAPAVRALANLDDDERVDGTYLRHIYLLHPAFRMLPTTKLDVVFVHGLLGGAFVTWRQRDRDCTNDHVTAEATSHTVTSDVGTTEYLENVTDLKVQEWEEIMHDYEMVMADCPEETNGKARGPYTYTGSSAHRVCRQAHKDKECRTACWPKDWLPNDCGSLRIIGVNYNTAITAWNPTCPEEKYSGTLKERSDELLTKLKSAGLGERPIVWVTHSMGGLLVKYLLCKAWESSDKSSKLLSTNTKGIIFYSCPHQGSPVAKLAPATALLLSPTIEVKELREHAPHLASLHVKFLQMLEENPIEVISFAETKLTEMTSLRIKFNFVPILSANPGVGEFFAIPQDHLCICKPASRQSFLYQKVLHLINECISRTKD